jgi:hypothetical protein
MLPFRAPAQALDQVESKDRDSKNRPGTGRNLGASGTLPRHIARRSVGLSRNEARP